MNLAVRFLAVFLMSGVPSYAHATCRARPVVVHRQQAVVVQEAVVAVTPVAVATFVPIAVAQYGVGYNQAAYAAPTTGAAPMSTAPTAAAPDSDLRAIIEEIKSLRKEVLELRQQVGLPGQPQKVQPQAGKEHPVFGVFKAKCAACHESQVAQAKGKGFVLLLGNQLAKLTDRQVLRVGTYTYTGRMPPANNTEKVASLTDAEVGTIMEWADSLK